VSINKLFAYARLGRGNMVGLHVVRSKALRRLADLQLLICWVSSVSIFAAFLLHQRSLASALLDHTGHTAVCGSHLWVSDLRIGVLSFSFGFALLCVGDRPVIPCIEFLQLFLYHVVYYVAVAR